MKKQRKIESGTGWPARRMGGGGRIIVWIVAAGLLWAGQEGKAEPPSDLTRQRRPVGLAAPVSSLLIPQQEAAALKKEEIELAERIMKEFPTSEDPIVLMGNVQTRHGNTAGGIELWKKVLQSNPRRADVYNGMGWTAMAKGQYEEAIGHWRKAVEIDPQMPGVHNATARALTALGRQTEAIEELKKEIKISPRSSFSYFLLGQQYLQQKDYEKAGKSYEKAIELEPNNTSAHYGLFTVYTRLNQPDKAQQHLANFKKLKAEDMKVLKDRNDAYNDLLEVRKGAAETFVFAGQIYLEQGNQKIRNPKSEIRNLKQAEELLKRATTLDPNNTAPLIRLASMYQTSNRIPEALEIFKKVSEIEPDNLSCFLNIGLLYSQLKRTVDAEEAFRKVISLAPKSSDGYRELALLYLKMGIELQQARQLAEKAVELEPIAVNYMVLSRACDKNGDTPGALSAIKRAVELEPNNPIYQQIYQALQKRK